MEKLNKVLYIAERDIDLLLLEELNVNPDFSAWLYQKVALDDSPPPSCTGAWHSVTHPKLGESDLIVIYESGLSVLIENKVDAQAQPEQGSRYKQRGRAGIADGLWKKFVTCVVAPGRYLTINSEARRYDIKITYEQIRDWFEGRATARANYKAYLLNEAIEQQRRGYSPEADEDVTQFWLAYWNFASKDFLRFECLTQVSSRQTQTGRIFGPMCSEKTSI